MNFIKKNLKGLRRVFLHEFSSLRLAITLFVFLVVTTLVGTILPEEPLLGRDELIKKYGIEKYKFLKSLGLTDVFHSWWYLALLVTLGVNLTVASFKRVFPKWYLAFAWPIELNEKSIKKLPVTCELDLNNSNSLESIEKKLRDRKFRTKITTSGLVAVKGGWHRLGASITHIGILILLFGSLISVLTGFNGIAQVSENEGFYLTDLGNSQTQIKSTELDNWVVPISKMPVWFGKIPVFLVRVNKTWKEVYENGLPKQWYTDLSILDENKKELIRKTISVNNPIEFKGLDVYQSSWGRFLRVSFNEEIFTLPIENFNDEEVVFLPLSNDIALKLNVEGLILKIYSLSRKESSQKYLGQIKINNRLKLGPLLISYLGIDTVTGLQFKSNPGAYLMYPGLVFIVLGVFIAFGSKKQIWAKVVEHDNKIVMGGKSDRSRGKFFQEFEEIVLGVLGKK